MKNLPDPATSGNSLPLRGFLPLKEGHFGVIAGPCAVESLEQMLAVAALVRQQGACCLRGGAFKPRTSPYSFQGLEHEGLRILKTVTRRTGLPVVTEVMDASQIAAVRDHADVFQVGARNMQNFSLLKALARERKPVVLKRGPAARLDEWLMAAEYLLAGGNTDVILCERGIRAFETALRNTLDLAAVAYLKQQTHLPVIVDPPHATGRRDLIIPLARAALACGADGLMVEVHPCPTKALCDGGQSLGPQEFTQLMRELRNLAGACGKKLLEPLVCAARGGPQPASSRVLAAPLS